MITTIPPAESFEACLDIARELLSANLRLSSSEARARVGPMEVGPFGTTEAGTRVIPIRARTGTPFLWIVLAADLAAAERIAGKVVRGHPYANVAIAATTATGPHTLIRYRHGRDDVERFSSLDSLVARDSVLLAQPFVRPNQRPSNGLEQRPLSARVESLLFELHSDLRDIDGMHPDAALDELCKLVLAKTYDEREASVATPRLQRPGTICDDEVAAIARATYDAARTLIATGDVPSALGVRGAFASTFSCSNHALARLVEKLAPFHLTSSSLDIKARAFQRVLSPATRAGLGQFFTPAEVIRFMVQVVQPKSGECVVDPFAGSGHFLTEVVRHVESNEQIDAPPVTAWAIEKSERMVRVAYTDLLLHETSQIRLLCSDSLVPFRQLDGLGPASADLVLTNPPFGSLLRAGAIAQLGPFSIMRARNAVPLEVLGLERSIELLRPGGRLGIVLPDGIFGNQGSRYVRDWIARETVVRAIVSLPIATFAPYGANIKTSILFARKLMPGERPTGDERVLMGAVESVGYDSAGRPNVTSDLDKLAGELISFFSKEHW